eukprot:GHRQ01024236.1.p1 GENE.GHRQ01024236.1~~GHRQ01024236.1.p1  ORF type:complete len:180 (+),score=45.15 GHRQ01024236.1:60-599(+)
MHAVLPGRCVSAVWRVNSTGECAALVCCSVGFALTRARTATHAETTTVHTLALCHKPTNKQAIILAAAWLQVKELAAKARSNKLQPHQFMGGTFTISNLGMYGLSNFSAIINPPQAAILAVGGAAQRVVFGTGAAGVPSSESYMTVTLSADHRVFDGELATRLLDAFTKYMENPVSMAV